MTGELVGASRLVRAKGTVVLRVAQTVQVGDVVTSAGLPAVVRRPTRWVLRRWWERGLFAVVMGLGFSVRETVPLQSLTLARPLARGAGWASGAPRNALVVRLGISASGDATEVRVSLGLDDSRTLRSRAVRLAARLLRPLLAWALRLWLVGLETRIDVSSSAPIQSSDVLPIPGGRD